MALSDEFVFVLPVAGAPYYLSGPLKRDAPGSLAILQGAVGGPIEAVRSLVINPGHVACCPRWELIAQMLKHVTTKVYLHEMGFYGGAKNLHAMRGDVREAAAHGMNVRGYEHYFYGDLAVVINRKTLNDLGVILECLALSGKFDKDGMPEYKQPVFMTELN